MAASESGTSAPEAGAPEDEIEIIPEIIDAGADVIWRAFDGTIPHGSSYGGHVATLVFQAMCAARNP